jgi:hypothetical protein
MVVVVAAIVAAPVVAASTLTASGTASLGEAAVTLSFSVVGTGGWGVFAALAAAATITVGATHDQTSTACTFDCWKNVVHDDSLDPSNGRLLGEIVMDPRIKHVSTSANNDSSPLPEIILENIWNEKFAIEYVTLPSGEMAAHAVQLE